MSKDVCNPFTRVAPLQGKAVGEHCCHQHLPSRAGAVVSLLSLQKSSRNKYFPNKDKKRDLGKSKIRLEPHSFPFLLLITPVEGADWGAWAVLGMAMKPCPICPTSGALSHHVLITHTELILLSEEIIGLPSLSLPQRAGLALRISSVLWNSLELSYIKKQSEDKPEPLI